MKQTDTARAGICFHIAPMPETDCPPRHAGGFAFEVQLSLTEKGQYAVAYGLSCKKDCHELHAT
ncbi:hypothetical protein, partial [Neisseria meningitidis]